MILFRGVQLPGKKMYMKGARKFSFLRPYLFKKGDGATALPVRRPVSDYYVT